MKTAYHYDNNDRFAQTGGTTYSYVDNGNTLTEMLDANIKTYHWDGKEQTHFCHPKWQQPKIK